MLNQLKTEVFYNYEEKLQHDAHITAYQAQKMGIKVVVCDSAGKPVYDTVAPMASYLLNTAYNM
jgi:hypothetical protein